MWAISKTQNKEVWFWTDPTRWLTGRGACGHNGQPPHQAILQAQSRIKKSSHRNWSTRGNRNFDNRHCDSVPTEFHWERGTAPDVKICAQLLTMSIRRKRWRSDRVVMLYKRPKKTFLKANKNDRNRRLQFPRASRFTELVYRYPSKVRRKHHNSLAWPTIAKAMQPYAQQQRT